MMKYPSEYHFNRVSVICLVVCSLFASSCAGDNHSARPLTSGQQTINVEPQAQNRAVNATANSALGAMYWLYMKAGDFKALANKRDKDKRKLMFQFCLTPKQPDILTLRGWAGKGEEDYDNTKFILEILKPDTDIYEKEIYFSSQKIPGDDVNALLKDIGSDDTKYVIFDPQYSPADNHVFYNVYVVNGEQFGRIKANAQPFAPLSPIATNPSPPASSKNSTRN